MCNDKEFCESMSELYQTLSESQEPLPAEFQKVLDDNRWELMVGEPTDDNLWDLLVKEGDGYGQIP